MYQCFDIRKPVYHIDPFLNRLGVIARSTEGNFTQISVKLTAFGGVDFQNRIDLTTGHHRVGSARLPARVTAAASGVSALEATCKQIRHIGQLSLETIEMTDARCCAGSRQPALIIRTNRLFQSR